MQAMLGDCGPQAVSQSIPMTPIQFARLFQSTMRKEPIGTPGEIQFWKNSSSPSSPGELPYPKVERVPSCSKLLKSGEAFSGFVSEEFREITTADGDTATSPNGTGTAGLISNIKDAGKMRVSVAALAEQPVQYTVCSGARWDNKEIVYNPGKGEFGADKGGPMHTWIAFENPCQNFSALVTVTVTEAGALF
jgi:hypothetical protein